MTKQIILEAYKQEVTEILECMFKPYIKEFSKIHKDTTFYIEKDNKVCIDVNKILEYLKVFYSKHRFNNLRLCLGVYIMFFDFMFYYIRSVIENKDYSNEYLYFKLLLFYVLHYKFCNEFVRYGIEAKRLIMRIEDSK